MGGSNPMNHWNFNDIFKKSFLNFDKIDNITFMQIFFVMLVAFLVGTFIYYVYKRSYNGVIYNRNFNLSLIIVCMITAMVIVTISSNIVLSLGMVGALSIVRFRVAVKDPLDVAYLFWAIAAGIATGAGTYQVTIFGSIFIGLIILIFVRLKKKIDVFLLIIKYEIEAAEQIKVILSKYDCSLKNKTVVKGITEVIYEIRIKGDNTAFLNQISAINGVSSAVLTGYRGEIPG